MNIEVLHCSGIFRLWLGFREKTNEKNTITKIIVFFLMKVRSENVMFSARKIRSLLVFLIVQQAHHLNLTLELNLLRK